MIDQETGKSHLVNTNLKRVRNNYAKYQKDRIHYYEDSFKKSGAGFLSCGTNESYVKKLLGYFKQRG